MVHINVIPHLHLGPPKWSLTFRFVTKVLYASLASFMRATRFAYLILI